MRSMHACRRAACWEKNGSDVCRLQICAVEQIGGLRCLIKRQHAYLRTAAVSAGAGEVLTSTHFLSCSLYEKISMLGSV